MFTVSNSRLLQGVFHSGATHTTKAYQGIPFVPKGVNIPFNCYGIQAYERCLGEQGWSQVHT